MWNGMEGEGKKKKKTRDMKETCGETRSFSFVFDMEGCVSPNIGSVQVWRRSSRGGPGTLVTIDDRDPRVASPR